jgi:hypothetical protein
MKCAACGAEVAADRTACEYCGSRIERPVAAVVADSVPGKAEAFAAVRASAAYAGRNSPERRASLPRPSAAETIVPVAFGCLFTVVSLVILAGFLGIGGLAAGAFGAVGAIPLLMAVVPLAFVGVGVFIIYQGIQKNATFSAAPVLARPAMVTSKRTSVSGGKETSVSTSLYLTFEFEDGSRAELRPVAERLYGELAEGDAGVLFSRANVALEFDRVRM